jgi:hypothetical protein
MAAVRLFKYVPSERIDVLRDGVIRFTQPSELNDPFESAPYLSTFLPAEMQEELLLTLRYLFHRYSAKAVNGVLSRLGVPAELSAFLFVAAMSGVIQIDPTEPIRNWLARIVESKQRDAESRAQNALGDRFGILSLSETANNLLMWSHYADHHRGFAFVFNADHPFFRGSSAGIGKLGVVQPVTYVSTRPSAAMFTPTLSLSRFVDQMIHDLFWVKNAEWQYEREWRLIYPLDRPKLYPHTEVGTCHLFPFPREALTAVIVGARVSAKTLGEVESLITTTPELRHIELRRRRVSNSLFNLEVNTLNLDND